MSGIPATVIGIIGCGNISDAYLRGAARSRLVRVKSVADMRAAAAETKAREYGVDAVAVDALLADTDIEIVVNLTVPAAHAPVSLQIIEAGKHAYLEKPLASRFAEAKPVMQAAAAKGLRVGCAPDTFLGAAHQACRYAIDAGRIGVPVAGAAAVLSHGMEHWHPNPAFFFQHGGGPIHDLGPYYVTQLVNLLGPVSRVAAATSIAFKTRTITSEPLAGQTITVEVPTTVNGVTRLRQWCERHVEPFLGCMETSPRAAGDLRQRRQPAGARSELLWRGAADLAPRRRVDAAEHQCASVRRFQIGPRAPAHKWRTIASSDCWTWRRQFAPAAYIASTAHWRYTCWRCWTRSSARRWRVGNRH